MKGLCWFFSVKGIVERIEDNNDESKKRMSERTSIQMKPPSDKVRNFHFVLSCCKRIFY